MREANGGVSRKALELTSTDRGTNRSWATPSSCLKDIRWTRVLIALIALVGIAAAQSSSLFTTVSLNPVASLPLAIASGDFNGDGIADEAVTSSGTNSVSILLGTGDGNFLPAAATPTGKLTIKDGKTVLISTTLVNGQTQISTSLLTTGAHNITASFAGSASFAASQTTLSQLIQ